MPTSGTRKVVTHAHWLRATTLMPSWKMRHDQKVMATLRRRICCTLRRQGCIVYGLKHQWLVEFRLVPYGRKFSGRIRPNQWRPAQEMWGRGMNAHYVPRPFWLFDLEWHDQRLPTRPDFWFLGFADGGTIVLPEHVLPHPYMRLTLKKYSAGYWPWKYWERWDVLRAWPDVPEDLIRREPPRAAKPQARPERQRPRSTLTLPPLRSTYTGRRLKDRTRAAQAAEREALPDGLPTG